MLSIKRASILDTQKFAVFERNASRLCIRRTVKTSTVDWKPITSNRTNLRKAVNNSQHKFFRGSLLGLLLAMPAISFVLGCWQVKRLKWKVDLIKKCEFQLAEPPMDGLPADLDPEAVTDYQYRRFRVKGRFDYTQEMFLGPRIRNGEVGYLLITPFIREGGGRPILIERGWIRKTMVMPSKRSHGYLAHLAMPQGEITIEAMLRVMPTKASIHLGHEPGTKLFHVHDVPTMAEQSNSLPIYAQMMYSLKDQSDWRGPVDPPPQSQSQLWNILFKSSDTTKKIKQRLPSSESDVTLEWQEFEFKNQGVPIAKVPTVSFTNNHLQYLITWFGVSAASTTLLIYSFYKNKANVTPDKIQKLKTF